MNDEKRLKDPIYGYINIPNRYSKDIIDTDVFQRLRRIIQTSYAPLYASSIHNRFVHSLGVFHLGELVANTITEQVRLKKYNIEELDVIKEIFLLACLLHDVGHAPFSHTGEKFYLSNTPKEKYTQIHNILKDVVNSESFEKDIPKNESKAAAPHEIMSVIVGITSFGAFFPTIFHREFFARCITGYKYSEVTEKNSFLNCFISMLNSKVIDVDRMDYLIRDAFFTGFDTIRIDYERLLTSVTIVLVQDEVDDDEEDDDGKDNKERYELAYQKNAISVIENVVYAHDAERKWIQTHPIVLYDIYILQHVISRLDEEISDPKKNKLFSRESLSPEGIEFSNGLRLSLLCDDDIIFLMKSRSHDNLSKEYFNRKERRHPIWKSEAEYKAYLNYAIGEGEILEKLERALIETEQYVRKNSDSWIINEGLMKKLEEEIQKLENPESLNLGKRTVQKQLSKKKSIRKVLKSLYDYAKSHDEEFDFVILGASQFYSGFNRPDVSDINIVFGTAEYIRVTKFGKIVSLLNSDDRWRENFFYLYHKSNSNVDIDKEEIFMNLIQEFVK